jgi:hypothetical protein
MVSGVIAIDDLKAQVWGEEYFVLSWIQRKVPNVAPRALNHLDGHERARIRLAQEGLHHSLRRGSRGERRPGELEALGKLNP